MRSEIEQRRLQHLRDRRAPPETDANAGPRRAGSGTASPSRNARELYSVADGNGGMRSPEEPRAAPSEVGRLRQMEQKPKDKAPADNQDGSPEQGANRKASRGAATPPAVRGSQPPELPPRPHVRNPTSPRRGRSAPITVSDQILNSAEKCYKVELLWKSSPRVD